MANPPNGYSTDLYAIDEAQVEGTPELWPKENPHIPEIPSLLEYLADKYNLPRDKEADTGDV